MTIYAGGSVNLTAQIVPDVLVQVLAPQVALLNGVPSNVLGIVGSAQWGPVNQPITVSQMPDFQRAFGLPQNRKYDLGTHVGMAIYQGANNMRGVRVTDGTDTAASASIGTSNLTLTGKYTGTLGNSISIGLSAGTAQNSWRATITIPGQAQEVFDNIQAGIVAGSITAGTGWTSVPAVAISAPTGVPAVQATAGASLTVQSAPTVVAGGTSGFAVNDLINLANGVQLKVATVTSGAVATVTLVNGGSLTSGNVPTGAQPMVSTSGAGVGVPTFTLVWGLGPLVNLVRGSGYNGTATATITGGGGTGGAYTLTCSYWGNMADAINNGQNGIRGPSNIVVASGPAGTTAPVVGNTSLSGGTDGANGVNSATLVGLDTTPRKGMYALRQTGCSVVMLADADDSTQWTFQVIFAQQEGLYVIGTGPAGDTITNAIATKAAAGIDSAWFKLMFGDWLIFADPYNNVTRIISPQSVIAGLLVNLSVQNSTLNKPLAGFVGTQRQQTGAPYSLAELQQLAGANIDIVANPSVGGNYFSARLGHNTSSNAVINNDQYTRLTNYVAQTLNAGMGIYVGKLNTVDTWRAAKATCDAFLQAMKDQKQIVDFSVVFDATNNPQNRVALGYGQCDIQIQYPGILEKLLLNVTGGASVQIQRQSVQLAA